MVVFFEARKLTVSPDMSAEQKELLKADLAMFKRVNAASRLETPSTKWVYAMRNQVGYAGVGRLPAGHLVFLVGMFKRLRKFVTKHEVQPTMPSFVIWCAKCW